jgi:hypothetical protein
MHIRTNTWPDARETLRHSRPIPGPIVNEKTVSVRVLRAIFVNGKACEIGSETRMSLSDGQALQNSTPPTVKII